jgi:predicted GIY-YIG superfamily endonuclease
MKQKYFSLNERHYFKFLGGIYILLSGKSVVYIGGTQSIFSRILEHKKDKDFDSFRVLNCKK